MKLSSCHDTALAMALPVTALFLGLPGLVRAQSPAASRPATQKGDTAQAALAKLLAKEGVRVDKAKGRVHAEGHVNLTRDYIEYVAIGPRGKKHEALVMLKCKGSTLNAALLALGLKPGKNVDFKPVVPLPSEEEVMKGAPTSIVVPPEGPRLFLTLSWHDDKQVEHAYPVEDLILDVRADAPVQGAEWIYFGGMTMPILRGEPPVYVADYEQDYITTYFTKPDSHLITIKHPKARFDDNWWPNAKLLPKRGTPCTLTLSLKPFVKHAPRPAPAKPARSQPSKKQPATRKQTSAGCR